MKLALLTCALCLALAGCEIIVVGSPTPEPPLPLEILSFSYYTDYEDQSGDPLICDDRLTTLTYSFQYRGELELWHSYLKGVLTQDVRGEETFDPGSNSVREVYPGFFEVRYIIEPYAAPLSLSKDEVLQPQDIEVVPAPIVAGMTRLHLTLDGGGEQAEFVSQDIPVINNCP